MTIFIWSMILNNCLHILPLKRSIIYFLLIIQFIACERHDSVQAEGLQSLSPELILTHNKIGTVVKNNVPGYHLPEQKDRIGAWAEATQERAPYLITGNFNGDHLTDVAVILLGDTEWTFGVFLKAQDSEYQWIEITHFPGPDKAWKNRSPQTLSLSSVRGSEQLVDTIELKVVDVASRLEYRWSDKHKHFGLSQIHAESTEVVQ